jgi:AsmA protein
MRFSKKTAALTLAAIAAVLLLALAILWVGLRTDAAHRAVGEYLGKLTGLPVTVNSLSIGILPTPSLEIGGLQIAQPPGFGTDPLIELGSARVALTWGATFGGDPALRSISISDLTVRPEFIADGSDNFSALIERLSKLGGEGESRWSIGKFELERGALEFHDVAADLSFRLTAIGVAADSIAPATDFPVELQLAGVSGGNTLHFSLQGRGRIEPDASRYLGQDLTFKGWLGGEPLPLAGIELEGGIGVASYDGKLGIAEIKAGKMTLAGIRSEFELQSTVGDRGTSLAFALATSPFSPRSAAAAFGSPLPATADPEAFKSTEFIAKGRLDQGVLQLDFTEGWLDDTQWSGNVVPQFRQFRIRADRIDLDRYLPLGTTPPGSKSRGEKKATLEESVVALGKLDIDAEIRIDEARVAGAKLRDTVLKVERGGGATP